MPSATFNDIALRSTNPVKRAMDVICVIILQMLTLRLLAERYPDQLRNHPALGPNSILGRIEAGDTLDLPKLLIAPIRTLASMICADLRLSGIGAEPSDPPIPAAPKNPAAPAKANRPRPTSRHRAAPKPSRAPRRTQRSPHHATAQPRGDPRLCKRKALALPCLPTFISLRYRNE